MYNIDIICMHNMFITVINTFYNIVCYTVYNNILFHAILEIQNKLKIK